jgi:hypothetical protein
MAVSTHVPALAVTLSQDSTSLPSTRPTVTITLWRRRRLLHRADMNNAYGWDGDERSREEQRTGDERSREEQRTGDERSREEQRTGERDGDAPRKSRPSQRGRLTVDRKSFGFYHNLMGFPKVTVGEISGYALGGGFEMALMTDVSVVARDTRIGMPATRSSARAGQPHLFFHRLGPVLARRMLLTGDIIEARVVEHLGVFTETCEPGAVTARARYWAEKAAKMPADGSSSPRRPSAWSNRARPTRAREWPVTSSTPTAPTCSSPRVNSPSSRRRRITAPGRRSGYGTSTSTYRSRSDRGHLLIAIQCRLLL